MLPNTICVPSSEPVSNKDVSLDKTCFCHLVKSQAIRPSEHLVLILFFFFHCINKMLRSCNLLRQNVLNFGIKRIDVVYKRTLTNIAFHCNKIFHFKRNDFAIKLSD